MDPAVAATVLQALRTDGFCWLPRPAPAPAVSGCRAAIEAELVRCGRSKDPLNGHCPGLLTSRPVLELYQASQAPAAVQAVFAHGAARPLKQAQIALRFPGDGAGYNSAQGEREGARLSEAEWVERWDRDEAERGVRHWHIDGMNRSDVGKFSLLVGIFLNHPREGGPETGNLVVWPGSHHTLAARLAASPSQRALWHDPPSLARAGHKPLMLHPPEQGAVLLAHSQLAHGIAANKGSSTRYAVYYRVSHLFRPRAEHLSDLFAEFCDVRPNPGCELTRGLYSRVLPLSMIKPSTADALLYHAYSREILPLEPFTVWDCSIVGLGLAISLVKVAAVKLLGCGVIALDAAMLAQPGFGRCWRELASQIDSEQFIVLVQHSKLTDLLPSAAFEQLRPLRVIVAWAAREPAPSAYGSSTCLQRLHGECLRAFWQHLLRFHHILEVQGMSLEQLTANYSDCTASDLAKAVRRYAATGEWPDCRESDRQTVISAFDMIHRPQPFGRFMLEAHDRSYYFLSDACPHKDAISRILLRRLRPLGVGFESIESLKDILIALLLLLLHSGNEEESRRVTVNGHTVIMPTSRLDELPITRKDIMETGHIWVTALAAVTHLVSEIPELCTAYFVTRGPVPRCCYGTDPTQFANGSFRVLISGQLLVRWLGDAGELPASHVRLQAVPKIDFECRSELEKSACRLLRSSDESSTSAGDHLPTRATLIPVLPPGQNKWCSSKS